MKRDDLAKKFRSLPYFSEAMLFAKNSKLPSLRNQLSKWVKSGKLWRLKKGLYTLPPDERKTGLSSKLASNIILSPSYLSLEYMLSQYELIPERINEVTAITTHKTSKFSNPLGIFNYRHIKEDAFTGFINSNDEFGYPVITATPEKSLLDKIYLDAKAEVTADYLENDLRLQNTEILNKRLLKEYSKAFKSKKMNNCVKTINSYIKQEYL